MIGGLPLSFAEPWILGALIALPALWWLLRVMPPRPRRILFAPARLLFDVAPKEETPARTPWWLIVLRLTLAALLIAAAAGPIWNPVRSTESADGPLALIIDDGWSAAAGWDTRLRTADEFIAEAAKNRRPVAIVSLSESNRDISLQAAETARVALQSLTPKPYTVRRANALAALGRFLNGADDAELVWLSDGIDGGGGREFVDGLGKIAAKNRLTLVDGGVAPAHALAAPENTSTRLSVTVLRANTATADTGIVRASDRKGLTLGETPFALGVGVADTVAAFDLPIEIRNDIARLEIVNEHSAGAVQLLDKRWQRRAVGIVSAERFDNAQPLLASSFYLSRALGPFADTRLAERGATAKSLDQFLAQKLPMILLADIGTLPRELHERLAAWIEQGGVLVRFAGPRLAASDDDLVPVKLRRGGRSLGGALTWEKPQALGSFSPEGPFAGLAVPDDVTITRQVLAEPDDAITGRTWASLADGTPLVTGERRGKGLLALVHVTADTRWSNLVLSGTFVDMLRRMIDLSGYTTADNRTNAAATLAPLQSLDGFGHIGPPPATARPIGTKFAGRADADHPPGYYGPADGPFAVNALTATDRPLPLDVSGLNARHASYIHAAPRDLRGILLSIAFLLFAADAIILVILGGQIMARFRRRAALPVIAMAIALIATNSSARAQNDETTIKSLSQTRLAYVLTGNAEVDEITRAGLSGLALFLAQRTALEAGDPVGVDPARDELAFYPLIYWPIAPNTAKPDTNALTKINAYMKQGGTVIFDTRDAIEDTPGNGPSTPAALALRDILSSLDIPSLEPLPRDHVLTKTFYLLRSLPGRYTSGTTWVEELPRTDDVEETARPARGGDGVSTVIITSNDLVGAWAMYPDGQPMLPLTPGEPRQREFAFRAGVNIVMYTLTGNYKADQVHAPALIERLGQ